VPDGPKAPVDLTAASQPIGNTRGIEIFFVDLVAATPFLEAEEERTPRLSDADIARSGAMADGEASRLWRASRIATRIALERIGGAGLRRIAFEIEPGGRPVLGQGEPHFNVSHTKGAALIAIAQNRPVGIDIEPKNRALKMSRERRQRIVIAAGRVGARPDLAAENDTDVLVAWVQLEAVAKALGIGIGRLLTEEGVVGGRQRGSGSAVPRVIAVRSLSMEAGYLGGVAAKRLPDDVTVHTFPHANLRAFLRGQAD
jgi:4'-phosphopantetheinyl transferase